MGLDVTKAREMLQCIQVEHSNNVEVLKRNSIVLTSVTLNQDYDKVTKDLCFAPGMVRFIYTDWHNVTRSIEGHVCSVEDVSHSKNVKLWTEKNEMVLIKLSCVKDVTVVQLPPTYTARKDNHEF